MSTTEPTPLDALADAICTEGWYALADANLLRHNGRISDKSRDRIVALLSAAGRVRCACGHAASMHTPEQGCMDDHGQGLRCTCAAFNLATPLPVVLHTWPGGHGHNTSTANNDPTRDPEVLGRLLDRLSTAAFHVLQPGRSGAEPIGERDEIDAATVDAAELYAAAEAAAHRGLPAEGDNADVRGFIAGVVWQAGR